MAKKYRSWRRLLEKEQEHIRKLFPLVPEEMLKRHKFKIINGNRWGVKACAGRQRSTPDEVGTGSKNAVHKAKRLARSAGHV